MFCAKNAFFSFLRTQNDQIVISLQTELYTNQSDFKFKHEWQHALMWKLLESSSQRQDHCHLVSKQGITAVGQAGLILPPWRLANDFTSFCLNILFVLPASKRNIFLKLIVVKFSVWKHLLEQIVSVLLVCNKPRAYYSVLKSLGGFSAKTSSVLQSEWRTFTHFWFPYHPTLWGNLFIFIFGQEKREVAGL